MFGSKEKAPAGAVVDGKAPARAESRPSVLSEGLSVTGDIQGEGELLVEGRLEGSIRCGVLTIGESGVVHGRVVAETVLVKGEVEGEIEAPKVTLARTARVIGDVRHLVLAVDAGAVVEGRYSRLDEAAAGRAALPPRQESKAPSAKGQPPIRAKADSDDAVEIGVSPALAGEGEAPSIPAKPLH